MLNSTTKILMLASLLGLMSCKVTLQAPTQADVDRVSATYPDYTLAELREGMDLYTEKCSMCHKLKSPRSRSASEWKHIVPEMAAKANRRETRISEEEEESILRYLVTMSER